MHQGPDALGVDLVVGSGFVDGLVEVEVVLVNVAGEVDLEPG